MAVLTCEVRIDIALQSIRCSSVQLLTWGTNLKQERRSLDLYRRSSVHVAGKKSPWQRKIVSGRGGGDNLDEKEEDDLWPSSSSEMSDASRERRDPGRRG